MGTRLELRCIVVGGLLASMVLGLSVLVAMAAPANAAIKIYETSEDASLLGKIERGKCGLRGRGPDRSFRATARSTNRDYELSFNILYWDGYRSQYDFSYGTNDPGVFYLRGGGTYSNIFAAPGTEGLPAGGAGFRAGGRKLSVGFLPTPNQSFRKGVVLAGQMRCRD